MSMSTHPEKKWTAGTNEVSTLPITRGQISLDAVGQLNAIAGPASHRGFGFSDLEASWTMQICGVSMLVFGCVSLGLYVSDW